MSWGGRNPFIEPPFVGTASEFMNRLHNQYNNSNERFNNPFSADASLKSAFGVRYSQKYPDLSIFEIVQDEEVARKNPHFTLEEVYEHQHGKNSFKPRDDDKFDPTCADVMHNFQFEKVYDNSDSCFGVPRKFGMTNMNIVKPYDNIIDKRLIVMRIDEGMSDIYKVD